MNKWIIDRGYGNGCALGFQGCAEFIRKSINFAVNYGLIKPSVQPNKLSDGFVFINTDEESIKEALIEEGKIKACMANPNASEIEVNKYANEWYEQEFEKILHGRINYHSSSVDFFENPKISY